MTLLETRRGQYWVATTNGAGLFNPSPPPSTVGAKVSAPRFKAVTVGNSVQSNNVRLLFEDHAGQLWAGTAGFSATLTVSASRPYTGTGAVEAA